MLRVNGRVGNGCRSTAYVQCNHLGGFYRNVSFVFVCIRSLQCGLRGERKLKFAFTYLVAMLSTHVTIVVLVVVSARNHVQFTSSIEFFLLALHWKVRRYTKTDTRRSL